MRLTRILTASAVAIALSGLTACKTERSSASLANRAALPTMERVALAANACWFKSGDASFKPYRLAPELNSFSGRPRILAVPARSPESRPMLVVQAEGNPARIETFGPLADGAGGARIRADVQRWASGSKAC